MLKLKLQYFGHMMRSTNTLEKTLMLGKIEGRRVTEDEMVGWHHLEGQSQPIKPIKGTNRKYELNVQL